MELHVIPNVCSEYSEQKIQSIGRPFLVGWEYYLGFSIGQNRPYRRGILTPYLNFGIGANANEYPVNARIRFTYGFESNVKTKKRFNKSKSWQ